MAHPQPATRRRIVSTSQSRRLEVSLMRCARPPTRGPGVWLDPQCRHLARWHRERTVRRALVVKSSLLRGARRGCSRPVGSSRAGARRRRAGERRRQRGAHHPQLLLAQARSATDSHVSCGRRPLVCGRDSRRYQRHELMTHCPLTMRMPTRAVFALCDVCSSHLGRYG